MTPSRHSKRGIIFRLNELEKKIEEERSGQKDNHERVRDNEESIRNLNRDLNIIKESQVSIHKRITQNSEIYKEQLKEGFYQTNKLIKEFKGIFEVNKVSTDSKIQNLKTWQENANGAIKLLLGVPTIIAVFIALKKIISFLY